MSLTTDQIFFDALKQDAELMQVIGNRLYSTAIPLPDEEDDNVPVPYVILSFDGLTNDAGTKDDSYEGYQDNVTISAEIAAETRPQLGMIARMIRKAVHDYFTENWEQGSDIPDDYQFTAQAVIYDSQKPCYWQVLTYQCATRNDLIEDDDEQDEG